MAVNRAIFVAVAAALCFSQVLGAGIVKRSTDTSFIDQLQAAAATAQEAISNVTSRVSETLGLNIPAPETVANNLKTQTQTFATSVTDFVSRLQTEASSHQGEFSSLLQSVASKWNETAASLQGQNPEATKTAQELKTSLNSGIQTFYEETQKLVNAISPQAEQTSANLQEITRTALDKVQATANQFGTSLQAATQNQPAH